MNTSNVILAAKANSGKSTNNVWVVYTSDNSSDKMYCTSAYLLTTSSLATSHQR